MINSSLKNSLKRFFVYSFSSILLILFLTLFLFYKEPRTSVMLILFSFIVQIIICIIFIVKWAISSKENFYLNSILFYLSSEIINGLFTGWNCIFFGVFITNSQTTFEKNLSLYISLVNLLSSIVYLIYNIKKSKKE